MILSLICFFRNKACVLSIFLIKEVGKELEMGKNGSILTLLFAPKVGALENFDFKCPSTMTCNECCIYKRNVVSFTLPRPYRDPSFLAVFGRSTSFNHGHSNVNKTKDQV
jgi:hypothetical protein